MPLFAAPADGLEDPNKRAKMMLLVLGVVVVVAVVFLFVIKPMLNKSDDSADDVPTPVTTGAPNGGVATPGVPTPSAVPSPTPAPSYMVNGSTRDPFAQIAVQIAASASATPTTDPLPSVTADPNPPPTETPTETPTDTPTDTPTETPTETPTDTPTQSPSPSANSHTLVLLTVTGTSATLTVDGADVSGSAGGSLGEGIVLMKVTQDAVFVTYDSQAYAIAIGQTVTVDGTPAGRG